MRVLKTAQYYTKKFGEYHVATYAASASFFIMTAVAPLLMLALSIVSFTPWSTQEFIDMIAVILPESFGPLLDNIAQELVLPNLTVMSLSLVGILWTSSKSMLGLLDGLNAIADVNDTRNFVLKRVICIGYMLVLIFGLLVNLALRVFGQHIQGTLQDQAPRVARVFAGIMEQRGLTLFLIITAVFMLIYTFFPNKKMKFYMQIPGAAFTSLAWMGFSALFSIYVNRIGQFSTLYGGLTMMVLVMLWLYFCMYIVFIGAVMNKCCPELFWRIFVAAKNRRKRSEK